MYEINSYLEQYGCQLLCQSIYLVTIKRGEENEWQEKFAMEGFFESREKEKMQKMVRREIEVIHVY